MNTLNKIQELQDYLGARVEYIKRTSNDPIIHCNRFPSWEELTDEHQNKLVEEFKIKGTL